MEPLATSSGSSNASLIPAAAMDLLLVVPRLAQRAGSLAFYHMPEAMDSIAGKIFNGGSMIADATGQQTANSTITNTSNSFAQSTAAAAMDAVFKEAWREGGSDGASASVFAMVLQGIGRLKNFGGIFSYLTSRWALATFTAAIVLNRTQFYASSREHLRLRWFIRLAIYLIPIVAFLVQMLYILQTLRCQTSPHFALLRYGDPLKKLAIDFGGEGGFLYNLSSTLLFWQDDPSCCAARDMSLVALGDNQDDLRGSMSLLFYFFLTLCMSQLFETLTCALQGKQPMPETGMTLFEHSLAFAECEAMISSALGFGFFGSTRADGSDGPNEGPVALLTRNEVLQRLNVPPEVLLICLISCFSHLSSAVLAIFGIRHRVRLLNTAVWACSYMGAFIWSFAKILILPVESMADLGVLRFPTVCIVGFIPHLLIVGGIVICGVIYSLALLVTAFSVPAEAAEGLSFRQRLSWAYQNLQANVQFSSSSNIRIRMSEDFYTTLLKAGFSILTAASEAVYLNEGSRIHVAQMTWLEQKRIDEIAATIEQRKTPMIPPELLGDGIAKGVEFSDHQNSAISLSPYARERRSKHVQGELDKPNSSELDSGLGLTTRRNRMQLTFDFIAGMFWLMVSLHAQVVLSLLHRLGIERRPDWLLKAAGVTERRPKSSTQFEPLKFDVHEFVMTDPDGRLSRPRDGNVDIEVETRRMWLQSGLPLDDETLGNKLYNWWRGGGWFGDLDDSGDYQGDDNTDDTTSVISMSTNASVDDEGDDGDEEPDESGRRTPTQRSIFKDYSREGTPTPDAMLDTSLLSRLLNPQTTAERDEARLLSYNLQTTRHMTRSQYRRDRDRSRAQILEGMRAAPSSPFGGIYRTDEEEERELEHFILSRRTQKKPLTQQGATAGTSWESGAEGMGASGPQCVVCQSTPRTILVWPCGCLSMCDDCRVGLAARNFTKCICCRTDIAAYSRLYVP